MPSLTSIASGLFEEQRLGKPRGRLHWWVVVPLAYALAALAAVAALSMLLMALRSVSLLPPHVSGPGDGYRANLFDALVLSPVLETLVVAAILKVFLALKHLRFWRPGYVVTTSSLSWWAHGASIGALYPAVGFAVFADCLARGWTATPPKKAEALWAATASHALLNVPHVIKYWPW